MGREPFISIVMPVYNAAKYLNCIFQNILDQTFDNWELIVVDDCSQDGSREICSFYANKDGRIRTLFLEQNGGAGNARNAGMALAQGEYVTFVDADDEVEKDLCETIYESAKKNPCDVIVWGLVEEYYDRNDRLASTNRITFPETVCEDKKSVESLVLLLEEKTLLGYQWNKAYKRLLLREYDIKFEKVVLYEDYFFNIKVMEHTHSMNILELPLYHYKKRFNDSVTTRFVPEYFELSHRRVKTMYDLCLKWNSVNDTAKAILGKIYLRYILSALMRNSDKRAGMSMKERKIWIQGVAEDSLYSDVAAMSEIPSFPLRCLQSLLNQKKYRLSVLLGTMVYCVKQCGPMLFSKLKRNK